MNTGNNNAAFKNDGEKQLPKIVKPTLLLNKIRVRKNIEKMAKKSKRSNVRFRPHFKTHQSAAIGEWFREAGVESITVSSVEMATYFAENGWRDISIAFPVNVREIDQINHLAQNIRLGLLVESVETVSHLQRNLKSPVDVWLKVDVGYFRTGIGWDNFEEAFSIIEKITTFQQFNFRGLLTHSGHTYHAESTDQIRKIYSETVKRLQNLRERVQEKGIQPIEISLGDTPSCSLIDDFSGVDEIRPGNFVFYDAMQLNLGVCEETDIAVAVACPVVAKHPGRNEIVIYGGAVHLSKESIKDRDGRKIFGYVAPLQDNGWGRIFPGAYVSALSQEHGVIHVSDSIIKNINVGDLVAIIPVHSCLTVNLMKKFFTTPGEIITTMQ